MTTTIDFTKAISSGIINFEQACALMEGVDYTAAIQEGVLTFEEAAALQGMAQETATPKPRKKATKKAAKKADKKAAKADKPEEHDGPSYTKGGAVIQYAGNHTLKANHLRRVENAIERLVKAGFCVSWKRIGGWVWINHSKKADKKTAAEFKAAIELLPKGWEVHGSSIVDKNMLADYEDNFR